MKPTDVHRKIKCNYACWNSIQYPQGWEIWVCSIWSALQTPSEGCCTLTKLSLLVGLKWSLLALEKVMHWSKLSSRSPLVRQAQPAEMKRAAQLVKLWKCFKLFTALRVHPKVTHQSQTCADDWLAMPGEQLSLVQTKPGSSHANALKQSTAELGSQHIAQPIQHKINLVFSKHFNLLLTFLLQKSQTAAAARSNLILVYKEVLEQQDCGFV